eukprot:4812691-Prymnesium_polylepis.1
MALGRGRCLNRPSVRTREKRGSVGETHCVSPLESHSQATVAGRDGGGGGTELRRGGAELRRGGAELPSATLCSVEFQRTQEFFIELSVRPGRDLAISAHLLPSSACFEITSASSSALHAPLLIAGSSWLCHRSRHCLPLRPGSALAISAHLQPPLLCERAASIRVSSRGRRAKSGVHFRCGRGWALPALGPVEHPPLVSKHL